MQLLFAWFAYHALNNQRHFGTLLFSSFLANALVAGWAGGFGRQGASVPSSSSSPVFVSGAPTAKPAKLTIKMSGAADELFDDRLENEKNRKESEIIDLQTHTQRKSPSDVLSHISEACQSLGVDSHDVYGDFSSDEKESYLRKFEAEVAHHFGKEDAVFCLSGGMAQSIALMIHSRNYSSRNFGNNLNVEKKETFAFACHPTSHLLLHENDAFWELLGMEAVVVSPEKESYHYDPELLKLKGCLGMEPVRLSHVHKMFHELDTSRDEHASSPDESSLQSASAPATPVISYPNRKAIDCINIFTLMLELPHREIGGKLTPWAEVQDISALCRERGIRFHCDGARIFEASVGYG